VKKIVFLLKFSKISSQLLSVCGWLPTSTPLYTFSCITWLQLAPGYNSTVQLWGLC